MTTPEAPQLNASPYIVSSRTFPADEVQLPNVLNKMYFEVANAVNSRTNGVYDKFQIATGNRYFNDGDPTNRLQSFRQVYTLAALPNSTTATIPTGIAIDANTKFVNTYGEVQSATLAVAFTPWVVGTPDDAPYLRVNLATGNIEIITTTANWTTFSAIVVLEYILNN
jgi:hypothetical protein